MKTCPARRLLGAFDAAQFAIQWRWRAWLWREWMRRYHDIDDSHKEWAEYMAKEDSVHVFGLNQ
jgi:hypothetical protein